MNTLWATGALLAGIILLAILLSPEQEVPPPMVLPPADTLPDKPIPMDHEHGTQGGYTLQNLKFDARRCTSIPYDSPQPGTARQLQRLAAEGRPGACLGCGFENACAARGCALLRSVSKIVALIERK